MAESLSEDAATQRPTHRFTRLIKETDIPPVTTVSYNNRQLTIYSAPVFVESDNTISIGG